MKFLNKHIDLKKLEIINFTSIMVTILYLFISSILFTFKIFSNNRPIAIGFLILLPFLLIIYLSYIIKNKKMDKVEIIILILTLLSAISVEFSINYEKAILGEYGRYEGFLAILTYYILLLNARKIDKKYTKYIIYTILSISIINALYGFYQVGILGLNSKAVYSASGFISNQNMYGSLLSLAYPIAITLFYNSNKYYKYILSFIILVILSLACATSVTMSLIVGLIVTSIILIIYSIKDKEKSIKNKIIKLLIIIITLVSSYYYYSSNNEVLSSDLKSLKEESSTLAKGKINDDMGTGRMFIWKNSIPKLKDYIVIGAGPDNFAEIFNNTLFYGETMVFDKAHNDYLQKMLCEGIISGLLFIYLLLYIFYSNSKKKLNKEELGIYLGFICYSVVAFFNISLIRVAPFYFIMMGLITKEKSKQ